MVFLLEESLEGTTYGPGPMAKPLQFRHSLPGEKQLKKSRCQRLDATLA